MKKILLIDSQVLTKRGLSHVISELQLNVVAEACSSYEQLNRLIDRLKPEVLIIDPFFGGILNFEDLMGFTAMFPLLQVLIIYNVLQRAELTKIIDTGIKNILSKAAPQDEIIAAVQATLNSERSFCRQTNQTLFGASKNIETLSLPSLSPREKEIIHLIADGLPDNAIAQKLFLSFHTIRTHRKNITKKLGFSLKNAAELVWLISYLNDLI
jgi:DNA-binding NarL/FixJ family response regulator